ncbi:hypothetical protein HYFRA_00000362 [Hymenoscyphus fraxineus]|uniref:Uncharacterized protein n=1 Tax=Hymenoscyphus fraxineus TaxID=746836 RepID=A0A9N9L206_9HELO|nr:hypothetical protein HYFRA_00000362 [Hymenoscyphus fraxineus]
MDAQTSFPKLEHIADIHLDLSPALPSGTTPKGTTLWIPITGGTIKSPSPSTTSPKLNLTVLPGGGDYPTLHATDGVLSLDVNLVAIDEETKDLFRFQNSGYITLDEEVSALLLEGKGRSTEFGEKDVRETITCNTGSKDFGWMNFGTMVAQGRLLERDGGLGGIEFRVFRFVAQV